MFLFNSSASSIDKFVTYELSFKLFIYQELSHVDG